MSAFAASSISLYALSYDEPQALRDFRDAHGITYTLLSDPSSEVIRSFGILNTLIDEDDHPWHGIPYPGTYVVNAAGEITHKFFDNNLAVRAGPEQLLRAARGEDVALAAAQASDAEAEAVIVDVSIDGDSLGRTVQKDLVARLQVPRGRHVYAEPAPEGTVAVDIVIDDNECLVTRALERPTSEPHTLAGTDEHFRVHHGVVELRLPLTVNSAAGGGELTVSGEVRWQSCDDEVCDIPDSQRFELQVRIAETPAPALFGQKGAELEPNAMAHFQYMTERRRRD